MRLIQATSVPGKSSSTKSDVKGGDCSAFGRLRIIQSVTWPSEVCWLEEETCFEAAARSSAVRATSCARLMPPPANHSAAGSATPTDRLRTSPVRRSKQHSRPRSRRRLDVLTTSPSRRFRPPNHPPAGETR